VQTAGEPDSLTHGARAKTNRRIGGPSSGATFDRWAWARDRVIGRPPLCSAGEVNEALGPRRARIAFRFGFVRNGPWTQKRNFSARDKFDRQTKICNMKILQGSDIRPYGLSF